MSSIALGFPLAMFPMDLSSISLWKQYIETSSMKGEGKLSVMFALWTGESIPGQLCTPKKVAQSETAQTLVDAHERARRNNFQSLMFHARSSFASQVAMSNSGSLLGNGSPSM